VRPRVKTDHRKYIAIAAAVVAAIGLAGIVVGILQAAPSSSFLHLRRRLSYTDYVAAYPDLAISADHNYLAVVWVEGHNEYSGSKGHVYLQIASESSGWRDPVEVYHGSGDACAYDRAAVSIDGTTAHIAYVVWADCTNKQNTRLYYTTCSLTSNTCSASQFVLSSSAEKIFWVDIAVDESGNPHLAFARYQEVAGSLYGKILYRRYTGSGWAGTEVVHEGTGTTVNDHTPTIAWGGGCAHFAWEEENGGDILYRRRCAGGVWHPTSDPLMIYNSNPLSNPPHRPDIATAPGGRVFIVWDYLAQPETQYTPATHYLVYKRSNTGGDTFYPAAYPLDVGTDNTGSIFDPYTEHIVGAAGDVAYLKNLRPSVALNQDGWPAVAWHTGGVTGTYYTYAISGTDTSVDWVTPTLLFAGEAGAPVIGFGDWLTGTIPLLHVAYMNATGKSWDVYYDSNEADVMDIPTAHLPLVMRGH
jgi:hypothetical protein